MYEPILNAALDFYRQKTSPLVLSERFLEESTLFLCFFELKCLFRQWQSYQKRILNKIFKAMFCVWYTF